jgi:cellulose synthase/poly-beta-1,6-N-acetylglucosamine synthase-like glycosyltransferase
MEIIFFLSLFTVVYIYAGYPAMIYCLALLSGRKKARSADYEPPVTIVIAAYNEEHCIDETIVNKLALDYPPGKLEILVISDGSTDATDAIVRKHFSAGVRLIRQEPRAGKTAALNAAIKEAGGEILIVADANSMYERQALRKLLRNFTDPSVGYVTGKMIYTNADGSLSGDGCSAYMKYENFLRTYETKVHSIVGVDGGIDAFRKKLYMIMRPDQLPDFVLPLRVVEQGYRVVYEPEAVLKEAALADSSDEYRMRVRVSLRALWALWDLRRLLNVFKYGVFSWQLFSHKVLRYLAVLFLAGLLISASALSHDNLFYSTAFVLQAAFYAMAFASPLVQKLSRKVKLLYIPYYFTLINLAAGHALLKFIMGKKQAIWTPRKG